MKLSDIAWNVTEEEYRADPAYSFSTIAKFHREGFNAIHRLFDKVESPSLLFGGVVDTLVTDYEEFYNRYAVLDIPELSESLDAIARRLAVEYPDYTNINFIPEEELARIGEELGYYKTDKYKSFRVKKIKEECAQLYNILNSTKDKTVITSKLFADANACRDALLADEDTSRFLVSSPFNDDIEIFFQLKFKGVFENINLRGMMDIVIVDHKNKKIIPADLKTSYKSETDFPKSFIEWCYPMQANLYTYLIQQNIDKSEKYKDYTISSYYFVVVSNNSRKPMVWNTTYNKDEGPFVYNDKSIPNWREVVKELHFYLSQGSIPKYPKWKKSINSIEEYIERNK